MSYIQAKTSGDRTINVPNFLSGLNTRYDESTLSPNVTSECYNFEYTSGALKGAEGFRLLLARAEAVWTYKHYLMFYSEHNVYYVAKSGFGWDADYAYTLDITLNDAPKTINYKLNGEEVVIMCSPHDNMWVWNGVDKPYMVENSPYITSMTLHYERLFVTTRDQPNTVWFSDDLDPTNWNTSLSEGGFIELSDERGELIKVVSFLNYVYIFRERGISRLTAYADQTDFTVSNLFVTSGTIYANTIAVCGDRIIFGSSDGVFEFDGVSTRRILKNLDNFIKLNDKSVAVYHKTKYILSFRGPEIEDMDMPDYVNNVILCYGDDNVTVLRGYDMTAACSNGDDMFAVIMGFLCIREGTIPFDKKWRVPLSDLGSGKRKRIKSLKLCSNVDLIITVYVDEMSKVFYFPGGEKVGTLYINMTGTKFGMDITTTDETPVISRPHITFSVGNR